MRADIERERGVEEHKLERRLPVVVSILFALAFLQLGVVAWNLMAGDWNFWTDWKDRTWWPLITAGVTMLPLAAAQYVGWQLLRIPLATLTATAMMLVFYLSHVLGFQGLTGYPLNFTWPATVIPGAILLDGILMYTRGSWILTALLGGFAYGVLFYPANHFLIAPFLQPVVKNNSFLTLANLQGFELHRSATPEYLRVVGVGGLHTFAGQAGAITSLFTGAVCMAVCALGLGVGKLFAIWPISRFVKRV